MTPPYGRKRRTKEPLDESERGEWKAGLKLSIQKTNHGIRSPHFMANRWGDSGNSDWLYFLGIQSHCRWWLQSWIKRCLLLGRKAMTNLDSILKIRNITLPTKVRLSQSYGFSSGHVWMWGLDHKESWDTIKRRKIVAMSLSKLRELVMDREAWHAAVHEVAKSRTRLSDWTELNWL